MTPAPFSVPGVLFVTYGNGHITKVAPVVHALESMGVPCQVLALTIGYAQAQRLGLQPLGYKDFLHLADRERALAYGRQLWPENQHPDVDEFESCCYLGVNYLEWVETFGEEAAAELYQKGGRRSFLPLKFIGKIIDFLQPSVVVSTSSPRSEQAAIEAGVQRGIPTLTMLDLFPAPHDVYLHQKVYAGRITAASTLAGQLVSAAGIDAARIRITGCPAYDAVGNPANAVAGSALRQQLGWEGRHIVLWAGSLEQRYPGQPEAYFGAGLCVLVEQALRTWVSQTPSAALIVRYHPNQYHLFPDQGTQDRVYVSNPGADPLYPQLHAADTVLVQTSTVGFESVLIGKRLLNLVFSPTVIATEYDFSKLGIAEAVASLEELPLALNRPRALLKDRGGLPPAGPATPRVVVEIIDLMKA